MSNFVRSNGVPLSQYIDDRHIGQLSLPNHASQAWTNFELAEAAVFITSLALVHCGYFVALNKSVLTPTQKITFLGFVSDSVLQAFILPKEKREKFAVLRESMIRSKTVALKTLQRFAGKAISFSLAVPAAKLYIRQVNASISQCFNKQKPILVSEELKEELVHWRFLDTWEKCLPWKSEKHLTVSLCSDASNSGWGGILSLPADKKESHDYWKNDELPCSIAVKEAKALQHTLMVFSNEIQNGRVNALVDNKNLIDGWNKEGSRSISLTNEIKRLFHLCLNLNINLNLTYVPSQQMEADAPSRYTSDIDCRLSDQTWEVVDRAFGPHTIDLMALPSNVRTDRNGQPLRFFSPYPCVGAEAVNVFAQNLPSDENLYVFPPFVLIGPLLNFFKSMEIRLSIVVPDISPRKFWWPLLNSTCVDYLLIGKKGQSDVLMFPPNKKIGWHSRSLPWDLFVYRLLY